jgi:hypothetical protein
MGGGPLGLRLLSVFVVLAASPSVRAECSISARQCVLLATGDALGGGHPSEQTTNFGDRSRLRLKGSQGVGLLQFDLAALLADRTVVAATLHLTPVVDVGIDRVSTVAVPWSESEATYLERSEGRAWQGRSGSVLTVVNGHGGSIENSTPNAEAPVWQLSAGEEGALPIDPKLLVAIQQGRAHGIALYSNRVRDNHDIYSREQTGSGPRLSVTLAERDETPPARPVIGAPIGTLEGEDLFSLQFELNPASADTAQLYWALGDVDSTGFADAQLAPFGTVVTVSNEHANQALLLWAVDAGGNVSAPTIARLPRYGLDREPRITSAVLREAPDSVDVSMCLSEDILEGFGLFVTGVHDGDAVTRRGLYGQTPAGPRRSAGCAGPLHLARLPAGTTEVTAYLAPTRQHGVEVYGERIHPEVVESRFLGVSVLSDSANLELVSGTVVAAEGTSLDPSLNRWFDPVRGLLGAEVQPGGTAVWQLITTAHDGLVHAPVWRPESDSPDLDVTISRVDPVRVGDGVYADLVRPVAGPAYITPQTPDLLPVAAGAQRTVLLVEFLVPKTIVGPIGIRGTLSWQVGDETHEFDTTVRVAGTPLPDRLTWDTSLNTYGDLDGLFGLDTRVSGVCDDCPAFLAAETATQRLAHLHRSTLAQVPYGHSGGMIDEHGSGVPTTPFAPPLAGDGSVDDWSGWDAHFGDWLDGSAFADLPRSGIPVAHLFLPFNWNWPGPWPADQRQREGCNDLTPEEPLINTPIDCSDASDNCTYVRRSRAALSDFSQHITEAQWSGTDFQYFFNTKRAYDSVCQNLDEPTEVSDYATLRFLSRLLRSVRGQASPIGMRVDIGHPEYLAHAPEALDDALDLAVMGRGLFDQRVSDRLAEKGVRRWTYGAAVGVDQSLAAQVGEAWRAAARGLNGMVFWNVARHTGDPAVDLDGGDGSLLLFYPANSPSLGGDVVPLASMRLKATRRMAEDYHLLHQRPEFVGSAAHLATSGTWSDPRYLNESRRILFRRLDVGDPPVPVEPPEEPLPSDDIPDQGCGCLGGNPASFGLFVLLFARRRRRSA